MAQKRTSKKTKEPTTDVAPEAPVAEPQLPQLPKPRPRDIGELTFGKEAIREKTPEAEGAIGLEAAASAADRKPVADTTQSPFRKICDLLITAGDGSLHSGTAWFISPRTLVTCGHCVAVFRPGTPAHGLVRRILVMPARHGETQPSNSHFGWVEVPRENLRVHERWLQHGDLDFDIGAIILPPERPLGATVGFFGFSHFPDQVLRGANATLAGYPDDVADGTQMFETNPIRQVAPNHLFYDIFTVAGQSGSPVFFVNGNQQVACAVHNFGNTPLNRGVRITPTIAAQLNQWRA